MQESPESVTGKRCEACQDLPPVPELLARTVALMTTNNISREPNLYDLPFSAPLISDLPPPVATHVSICICPNSQQCRTRLARRNLFTKALAKWEFVFSDPRSVPPSKPQVNITVIDHICPPLDAALRQVPDSEDTQPTSADQSADQSEAMKPIYDYQLFDNWWSSLMDSFPHPTQFPIIPANVRLAPHDLFCFFRVFGLPRIESSLLVPLQTMASNSPEYKFMVLTLRETQDLYNDLDST